MAKQSKKQKANWMWIEQFFYKLDSLEERIKLIEDFLGGVESMKKVLKNCKKQT